MSDAYTQSGVDIEKGNEAIRRIKKDVASTHTDTVLTGIGTFGGLYDIGKVLKSYEHPVLVQSMDGVGTKLIVARMMNNYNSVGEDMVNHSCGDIVAMGARPLTFLDYLACEKLEPEVVEGLVSGIAKACRDSSVAILGGETAEMPGTYKENEYDIAGCMTGIVEKDKIITGEKIDEEDIILGFASNGLHTNGYSLARKLFFEIKKYKVNSQIPELGMSLGEALLKVHINYATPILNILDSGIDIRGIAHITGGGLVENIPRVLPKTLDAEIILGSWPMLPIFPLLQKSGNISQEEMYRVFNMGIGMVLIISPSEEIKIRKILNSYQDYSIHNIGKIVQGSGKVILK